MKSWKLVGLMGIVIALTGCVSLSPPTNSNVKFKYLPWKKRQARVSKMTRFVANGAFSIVETGKKPVLANYQWVQNNIGFYRIRVFSPLNIFNVTILGRLHSVTLWKTPKQHITASTPEQLIRREMGWDLPIRNLFYWIRGVTAPGHKNLTFDQYDHISTLKQNGWYIQFSHYANVKSYDLPQKIVLTRPHLRITLVIKHWTYP